jgi:hypothetical protein
MLPATVSSILASAAIVGFSGSRTPTPVSLAAVQLVAAVLAPAMPVIVGDARGIDQHAAGLLPQARVFRASAYRSPHSARSAYAMRSIACVQACAGGVWCSFPARPCPAGLRPSSSSATCFNGSGSGTWASLAFAIGSGCTPIVFLPAGIVPPAAFGLVNASHGWYVAAQSVGQLSFL